MARVQAGFRCGSVMVLAMMLSACAARTSSPAMPHPAPFPTPPSPSSIKPDPTPDLALVGAAALIRTARSLEGTPYQWGGDDPSSGFDCSGFVQYVLARHQVALPRTSAEQYMVGTEVDL